MRYNILSVDETGLTKLELNSILSKFNINIANFSNEADAVNAVKARNLQFDALVWTLNSVEDEDFGAISMLKSIDVFKNLPLIIVSKYTDRRYIIRAIGAGAVEFIAKPYDSDTVIRKICRVLNIPHEEQLNLLDEDIITFNFNEMFNKEIKSASRGGYPLTIMLAAVMPEQGTDLKPKEALELTDLFNRVIRTKLRETDTTFNNEQNLVILLPFADKNGAATVEKKLRDAFSSHSLLKNRISGYEVITAYVCYPDDGKIKDKLLEKLENDFASIIKETT